jgi:hypothetical protein
MSQTEGRYERPCGTTRTVRCGLTSLSIYIKAWLWCSVNWDARNNDNSKASIETSQQRKVAKPLEFGTANVTMGILSADELQTVSSGLPQTVRFTRKGAGPYSCD